MASEANDFNLEAWEARLVGEAAAATEQEISFSVSRSEAFKRITELTTPMISSLIELQKLAEHDDPSVREVAEVGLDSLRAILNLRSTTPESVRLTASTTTRTRADILGLLPEQFDITDL